MPMSGQTFHSTHLPPGHEQVLQKMLDTVRRREELGLSNDPEVITKIIDQGWCPVQRQVLEAEGRIGNAASSGRSGA